jgi:hypothetical protein
MSVVTEHEVLTLTAQGRVELALTYAAIVRIRSIAREIQAGEGKLEDQVAKIEALADGFHAVPLEVAKGEALDPDLFRKISVSLGIAVPAEYPASSEELFQYR